MIETDKEHIIYQRTCRNGLLDPFKSPVECIHSLAGIQSQVQQFAEVSIWNRCGGHITMHELAELYRKHEIINIWGQRHTLHMYLRQDWDIINDIYIHRVPDNPYEKLFPEEYAYIWNWLHERCSAVDHVHRKELQEIIQEKAGHLLTESDYYEYAVIRLGCLHGLFFGLPAKPSIKAFIPYANVRQEKWFKDEERFIPAVENIMERYFRHYGPATVADFCHWSGLPQGVAKTAFGHIRHQLTEYHHDGKSYFALGEIDENAIRHDKLFLLGKFDPFFVSYRHKEWIATEQQVRAIWQSAARVEAVILEGTELLGTWRHTLKGKKMSLQVYPFRKIKASSKKKISRQAEHLAFYWVKELDSVTYS